MTEQEFKTLGRYTILAELGRGGFATVYRALDPHLEREVALKVMHPVLLSDPPFSQRFRREAKALAALRHPNIIIVHEVNQAEGRMFIAMDLANGPSLDRFIRERGVIPFEETVALLKPVCAALDYAHGQGVVHRDLKPANILLDRDRGALLTDFGMARLMGGSSASMSLSGGIMGTPAYIAPEIWEAEAARPEADIYSLGCIVFEMLTGAELFTGESPMHIMRAHDKGPRFPSAWPEDMPPGIEEVLGKALDHQPENRYPSAGNFWQALQDLVTEARLARERGQIEVSIAPWRKEAQNAVASGEWSIARKAVSRWLALSPADPQALAMRAEIDRLKAREAQNNQARHATVRSETENALAAGDWAAARIAVSRWLSQAPNDPDARNMRAEIERRQALEAQRHQAQVAAYRRQTEDAIGAQNWQAARDASARWLALAPNDPDALAARSRIKQPKPVPARMLSVGIGIVLIACLGLGSAVLLRNFNPLVFAANPTPTVDLVVHQIDATATRTKTLAPTRTLTRQPTRTNTRPPTQAHPTNTVAHPTNTKPAPTHVQNVPGDPLKFMRDYYDLVSSHKCSEAFAQQTDRFKVSLGTIDKFHEYESWCKTIHKIEFPRAEVQFVDAHSASVLLQIDYTYTDGRNAVDRPILFGLVIDDSSREWRINSGRYTE